MPKDRGSGSGSEPGRDPFITIDDLTSKAEELATGLRKLGEYKHPLDVRRGVRVERKEVEKSMSDERESRQLKGAGRTYFLDVESTRGGKRYLRITESRKGEGDTFERSSVNVFPEDAEAFGEAVSQMIQKIGEKKAG